MKNHSHKWNQYVVAAAALLPLVGCAEKKPADAKSEAPAAAAAEEKSTSAMEGMSDVEKSLADLSAEDQKLAIAQKVCPVSGEPLGSMGTPIKVTVGDESAFVCCDGCVEELKKNFDKLTAKLEAPKSEEPAAN